MGGVFTKEKAISWAQYLDLVYSQSRTLYDLIPHASFPSTYPTKPPAKNLVDGVVGTIQPSSSTKLAKPYTIYTTTSSTPTVSAKVNAIQSSQSPRNKKKGKGKNKKPGNRQESTKTYTPKNDAKPKQKAKYPCLLCGDDHFMK